MPQRRSGGLGVAAWILTTILIMGSPSVTSAGASRPAGLASGDGGPPVLAATLSKPCGPGQAWIAGDLGGLTCLDARGFTTFNGGYGSFPGSAVVDLAACRDGTTWLATYSGLVSQKGKTWRSHTATRSLTPEAIACDAKKGVWAAAYRGVHYYDGAKLRSYAASKLGTGPTVDLVKDVAVGPDGHVWVVTSNSVATFDGSRWTYFEKGHGLDDEHYFEQVAVDAKGRVWAGTSSTGLLMYDGTSWATFDEPYLSSIRSLVVGPAGRVWVGTRGRGLAAWDGTTWTTFDSTNSPLPDAGVSSLATDARGRIWIGTDYGLAVLDGSAWTVYNMHDSGIPSDEIVALAVSAGGPALPTPVEKKPGTLRGRIVRSGSAVADIPVEICVGLLGFMFFGETPCSSKPYFLAGRTDGGGRFSFTNVLAGWYSVAWLPPDGKWMIQTGPFGGTSVRRLVTPGKVTDVGTIDLAK